MLIYLNIGTVNTSCYIRKVNYKINMDTNDKIYDYDSTCKNEIINCDLEILEKLAISEFKHNKTLESLILVNRLTNFTSSCGIVNKMLDNKNLFYHSTVVTSNDRKKSLCQEPITIWFTDLSCSGKIINSI